MCWRYVKFISQFYRSLFYITNIANTSFLLISWNFWGQPILSNTSRKKWAFWYLVELFSNNEPNKHYYQNHNSYYIKVVKIEKKIEERSLLQVRRGTYYTEGKKEKMLTEVTLLKNLQINRSQDIINISAENISIKYHCRVL